ALGDEIGQRQAIAAIAQRDLRHEAQMRRDEFLRRFRIAMLAPAFGEHVFFLLRKHRKLADVAQIASEAALDRRYGERGNGCHDSDSLLWLLESRYSGGGSPTRGQTQNPTSA